MLRRIIMFFILALVSLNTYADVDLSAFAKVNAKVDCIIANGGLESKKAYAVCNDVTDSAKVEKVAVDTRHRDEQGMYHWKNVGGSPAKAAFKSFAKQPHPELLIGKKIYSDLLAMGLTPEDRQAVFYPILHQIQDTLGLLSPQQTQANDAQWDAMLAQGSRYADFVQRGDVLSALSFRKGVIHDVVADFDGNLPTFVFPLSEGKELLWIPACQNFALRKPLVDISIPPPPLVVPGTEESTPPLPYPTLEQIPEEQKKYLWDFDAFVFYGEDYGSHAQVSFYGAEGALYPLVLEHGDSKDEFGIGAFINGCDGVNQGFHFDCSQWGVGPAYKHFSNDGWDLSLKPTFGQLVENGQSSDGRYQSHREMDLVGIGGGVNLYQRQLKGEKWFPETQIFWRAGFPFDMRVRHSYDARPIADTTELKRFDALVNFGVREILYDGEWIRPHIEVGYFGELPTGQSIRAQIGFSDHWKILFCSIGPNFDLMKGGESLIWSCGIDVSNAGRKIVGKIRQDQFRSTLKNYDEETGGFSLESDSGIRTDISAHIQTIDKETGGFSLKENAAYTGPAFEENQENINPLITQPLPDREAILGTPIQ